MEPARLLSPEEIAVRAGKEPAFLRLPDPTTLFAEREMRLRQLAAGHAMREYLLFAAELCRAQHAQASSGAAPPVPPAAVFEEAAQRLRPPLPAQDWTADGSWHGSLAGLLERLAPRLDGAPREAVRRLAAAEPAEWDRQAARLLNGIGMGLDLAVAPLVAAGLQVHGSRLVAASAAAHAGLKGDAFGRTEDPRSCPCCGSVPTAGVLRIGPEVGGQRYLHCSMCAAQWHLVRITCAHCGNPEGIDYRQLQRADAPQGDATPAAVVRAECCPKCRHYLKLVAMDKDPNAEPVADDLASLSLDLLVSDSGLERHGVNFLLLFGDAPEDADA